MHNPAMTTTFDQHRESLRRARALIDSVVSNAHGLPVGISWRERIPRLLWQHTVEDGDSVILLVERRNLGSARALLRPQLESLARAVWAKVYATDQQLADFAAGTFRPPKIGQLMKCLTQPGAGWQVRSVHIPFENIWRNRGDAFHDIAHRGTRAVARTAMANQANGDHVSDDELAVLYIACTCAGIAGAALLEDDQRDANADVVWGATAQFMKYAHSQD